MDIIRTWAGKIHVHHMRTSGAWIIDETSSLRYLGEVTGTSTLSETLAFPRKKDSRAKLVRLQYLGEMNLHSNLARIFKQTQQCLTRMKRM